MLKRAVLGIGCAVMVLGVSYPAVAQEMAQETKPAVSAQVTAAQTWLALVDTGLYEKSWESAGEYFKSMVSKEQWTAQVAAVRKPLGNLISRTPKSEQLVKAMPGAPDGEYDIITFETVLANKAQAVETVTVMKDKDGQWRLAGYYIR